MNICSRGTAVLSNLPQCIIIHHETIFTTKWCVLCTAFCQIVALRKRSKCEASRLNLERILALQLFVEVFHRIICGLGIRSHPTPFSLPSVSGRPKLEPELTNYDKTFKKAFPVIVSTLSRRVHF